MRTSMGHSIHRVVAAMVPPIGTGEASPFREVPLALSGRSFQTTKQVLVDQHMARSDPVVAYSTAGSERTMTAVDSDTVHIGDSSGVV